MDINYMVKNISKKMVEISQKEDLSLKEVWKKILIDCNEEKKIDPEMLLAKTISFLTQEGYDIVSTHPLKFKKYR